MNNVVARQGQPPKPKQPAKKKSAKAAQPAAATTTVPIKQPAAAPTTVPIKQPAAAPTTVPLKQKAQPAPNALKKLSNKQVATARAQLQASVRANGTMAVGRRTGVVGAALRNMGYSAKDALAISLDAPLSASMTDESAVLAALEYAESISKPLPPGSIGAALQPNVTPMPAKASAALAAYRQQVSSQTGTRRSPAAQKGISAYKASTNAIGKIANSLNRRIKPMSDYIGNLPVPGGLGTMFLLNLLFLGLVVPANSQGYTRAQLLWLTLMGRTTIPTTTTPDPVPASPVLIGLLDTATAIEDAAVAVANMAGSGQSMVDRISSVGRAVQQGPIGVAGGIIGAGAGVGWAVRHGIGGGPQQFPSSARGITPPPPPPPPPLRR